MVSLSGQSETLSRAKLSGPLLDRIDMHVEVAALPEAELMAAPDGESSDVVRERVERAHRRQRDRQGKANAELGPAEIDSTCRASASAEQLLRSAITKLSLSARAYHRILKVARTIADLAGVDEISAAHVGEAVQYRKLDRGVTGA